MGWFQRAITSIVPKRWADAMERESRAWMLVCPCGYKRSIWDLGGIRWKGGGRPATFFKCTQCGKRTWHTVTLDRALLERLEKAGS